MKKRLLLFAAVLTASANFMFAEEKTVQDSNGNTFIYDDKNDLDASSYEGQVVSPIQASISPNGEYYTLTINSDQTIKISDRNIIYNVKLFNNSFYTTDSCRACFFFFDFKCSNFSSMFYVRSTT